MNVAIPTSVSELLPAKRAPQSLDNIPDSTPAERVFAVGACLICHALFVDWLLSLSSIG